jgi:CRP/FNR family cyclic AMP-dependent transcriptional regulator
MSKCDSCFETGTHPFCNLSASAKAFFDQSVVEVEFPRGGVLFREGEKSNAVYVICSGSVKLSTTSVEGRTLILRVAQPGDVLGISAALADGDFEVTAEALDTCRVSLLRGTHLSHMLQNYGGVSLATAKALATEYQAAFDEVRMIALSGSAKGRLATLILKWAVTNERLPSPSPFIKMSLTHDELAGMTGTTRETMTRALSQLRRDKIIALHGMVLTVLNPAALQLCSDS